MTIAEILKNGSPPRPFEEWMMPGNYAMYHGRRVRISAVKMHDGERLFLAMDGDVVIHASDRDISPLDAGSDNPKPSEPT